MISLSNCQHCSAELMVEDNEVGTVMDCPNCNKPTTIIAQPRAPHRADALAVKAASRSKTPVFVIAIFVALIIGYFAGREHMKYEIRSAFVNAAQGISEAFEHPKTKDQLTADAALKKSQDDYVGNILVSNVRAKYETDALDRTEAVVRGSLKNSGNKTLKKIQVTAYFLDAAGVVISEDSYDPVLVTRTSADDALKPNYVREFGFKAEHVPGQWKEGRFRLAVTGIEFE